MPPKLRARPQLHPLPLPPPPIIATNIVGIHQWWLTTTTSPITPPTWKVNNYLKYFHLFSTNQTYTLTSLICPLKQTFAIHFPSGEGVLFYPNPYPSQAHLLGQTKSCPLTPHRIDSFKLQRWSLLKIWSPCCPRFRVFDLDRHWLKLFI